MNKNDLNGYTANNEDPAAPNAAALAGAPPGTPMAAAVNAAMNAAAAPAGRVDVNAETLATLSAAAQLLREHVEVLPAESAGGVAELEAAADGLDAIVVNGPVHAERAALAAAAPVAEEAAAVLRLWDALPANAANYGAGEKRKYDAAAELLGALAATGARLVKKGVREAGSVALNKTRRAATVVGKEAVVLLGKTAAGLGSAGFAVGKGLANIATSLAAAIRLRAAQEYDEFVRGRGLLAREHVGNVPVLVRALQDPRYAAAAEAVRLDEARQARLEAALNGVAALPPRAPPAQRRAVVNALAAAGPLAQAAALNARLVAGMGGPAPPPGANEALVNAGDVRALLAAADPPPPPPGAPAAFMYPNGARARHVAAAPGPPPPPGVPAAFMYPVAARARRVAAASGPPPPPGAPANLGVAAGRPRRGPGLQRLEYNERINMTARYNKEDLLKEARRRGLTVNASMTKNTLLDLILQNMVDNDEVRRPGMGGTRRRSNKRNKSHKRR